MTQRHLELSFPIAAFGLETFIVASIASFITTSVQFKDTEGNDVNKLFGEMTAEEIISYTEQTAFDVESRGGMLENITNNTNKIKQ